MNKSFLEKRACAAEKGFCPSLRSILGFTRLTDASPLTLVNPQEHRAFLPFFGTHNLSMRGVE